MAKSVREIMSQDCQCIQETATLTEAAKRLAELNVGAMPICGQDDRLKGMLTDRDIVVKALAQGKDPATTTAGELAQGTPVWIAADAPVDEALKTMAGRQIRRLPVIQEHKLVGIVAIADIARGADDTVVGKVVEAISSGP